MKQIVSLVLSIFCLFAFVSIAPSSEAVKYHIVKEAPNEKFNKDNLEIELSKKINKSELAGIANKLRSTRMQYDRLWIFYFLPNMNHKSGAWATTHFTPKLEVNILGSTAEEDLRLSKVSANGQGIIGKWIDNRPTVESVLVVYKKSKKTFMKTTYKDGSSSDSELRISKAHGKTKYQALDDTFGEYYMVENNGNLGMYSPNGKFSEAIKSK